jgi:hypothetical protein
LAIITAPAIPAVLLAINVNFQHNCVGPRIYAFSWLLLALFALLALFTGLPVFTRGECFLILVAVLVADVCVGGTIFFLAQKQSQECGALTTSLTVSVFVQAAVILCSCAWIVKHVGP